VHGCCVAFYGKPISELRSVTCRMGSHSVTYNSTQMNAPRLNANQINRYSIYLFWREGRLSWPRQLVIHTGMVYLPADSHPSKY